MTDIQTRKCPVCGSPVIVKAGRGYHRTTYCSKDCKKAAAAMLRRERAAARTVVIVRCAECGTDFDQGQIGRPRRFCSGECTRRASNRRTRRSMLPLKQLREAVCPHCGKTFIAKRIDRIYCYDDWCVQAAYQARKRAGEPSRIGLHTVTCDECGTEFTATRPEARWCSKKCANRHWGRVRSRRRTDLSPIAYTDLEIFERDRWRCHLCGKRISKTADRKAPEGATIDHLLPIALGGRDEPGNVAAAHNQCNREKRTRAMNEQLAIL